MVSMMAFASFMVLPVCIVFFGYLIIKGKIQAHKDWKEIERKEQRRHEYGLECEKLLGLKERGEITEEQYSEEFDKLHEKYKPIY